MRIPHWTAFGVATLLALLATAPASSAAGDTGPPTTPGSLRTTEVTDRTIEVAWDPATDDSGIVGYELYFDDNPYPIWTSALTEWKFDLNRVLGMIPGSTHTFKVRAYDPAGNLSAFSRPLTASFLPGDNTAPTEPGNLRATSNTADGLGLAWDPSVDEHDVLYTVGIEGYAFETREPRIFIPRDTGLLTLFPGQTYTVRLGVVDTYQNGATADPLTLVFAPAG